MTENIFFKITVHSYIRWVEKYSKMSYSRRPIVIKISGMFFWNYKLEIFCLFVCLFVCLFFNFSILFILFIYLFIFRINLHIGGQTLI